MKIPQRQKLNRLRVIPFLILLVVSARVVADERIPGAEGVTALERDAAAEVTVAAVQFEVSEERYRSVERLHTEIDRIIAEARERYDADLVVFPEYINVFLLASQYPDVISESDDLFEALAAISAEPVDDDAVAEVLQSHADFIADTAVAMWSDLADRHDVTVVAGTLFARGDPAGVDDASSDLRNRLLVFDDAGRLTYTQDKVYLTPVEADLLDIEPGSIDAAVPIVVDGLEIGFTICRDGYFSAWNRTLGDVDLWISVRANGEPYSREVYERFLTAMPERVAETDVVAGISASLTGAFLGSVWAGPSYVVNESGDRIAASELPVGTQITAVRMVRRNGQWLPRPAVSAD